MSDSDSAVFWASVRTLASTFRHQDPLLSGKLRQAASYFSALPEEEQIQLRHDVQLLTVQFSKLALAMTVRLDEEATDKRAAEREQ
jgi:hypothetical protein